MNLPSSPVELFECFFDREIFETFAEYSKTYAQSKGNMTFSTTPEELQTFLAILLLSGYGPVPRRRMYWSSDEDVGKDCVQSAMSRNRFEEMLRYLHVSDNAHLDVGDKMSKVTYFRAVQTKNLSIDESMVPYYGHGYRPCLPCQSSPCCTWSSSGICVPWQACPIRGQVWRCWSSRAELSSTAEMWSMWQKDEASLCQMQSWPTRQVLPAVPCSVKPQKVSLALYQTWLWLSNAGITPDNFTADNLKENTDSVICL